MQRESIGELEELVLLTVGSLGEEAYSVNIVEELNHTAGRSLDVTAIHSVLRRLEKKGMVKSSMGASTKERGGRRKRIFQLSHAGRSVIEQVMSVRMELYQKLPKLSFSVT